MFNSALEVSKFELSKIKTVSGIRGTIKKALRDGTGNNNKKNKQNKNSPDDDDEDDEIVNAKNSNKNSNLNLKNCPNGSFRATFEDKILMSDIVICRLWVPVDIKKFYNPLQTLLFNSNNNNNNNVNNDNDDGNNGNSEIAQNTIDKKNEMVLMKTTSELRIQKKIPQMVNKDSIYKPITRVPRVFRKMKVPLKLQSNLPFASKPKVLKPVNRKSYTERRKVILEPEEKKTRAIVSFLSAIKKNKIEKKVGANAVRLNKTLKKKEIENRKFAVEKKDEKKRKYTELGKAEKMKENKKHKTKKTKK
jgi:ribosome biogenesis protein BMS1